MRFGQRLLIITLLAIVVSVSCGPGYKIGDAKIKRIGNIHNKATINRSKLNYKIVQERKKEHRKIKKERWKKQMKNRYKY